MKTLLLELLKELEDIGKHHSEIYDSECRQAMSNAIHFGFLKPTDGYNLPNSFELFSDEANARVRAALSRYIDAANEKASETGIMTFHERLDAFQDGEIRTPGEKTYFDDFFGYARHKDFDEFSNVVS